MANTFHNLFMYKTAEVESNELVFKGVTLYKSFPKAGFTSGTKELYAVVHPVNGTVWLYTPIDGAHSSVVTIKEWIESDGLCRTDTSSYRFSTAPLMQNSH